MKVYILKNLFLSYFFYDHIASVAAPVSSLILITSLIEMKDISSVVATLRLNYTDQFWFAMGVFSITLQGLQPCTRYITD